MKRIKKIFALLIAMVMVLGMSTSVFAQTIGTEVNGTGSITVTNAAKGVDYKIYKLFDASVTGTLGGSIAYTGEIPESLSAYFWKDTAGNVFAGTTTVVNEETGEVSHTPITDISTDMAAALKAWAGTESPTASTPGGGADGSTLKFVGIPYGYYVITTSQGETAISVDSTNPDVNVVDKNATPPINDAKKYAGKEEAADAKDTDNNVNIGDTVTYTISFDTANYDGAGEDAERITSYIISDDFASGVLTNVNVTSITIGGDTYKTGNPAETPQFDSNGKITIPWTSSEGNNLYANGAAIVITYTATVADTAAIDGTGNKNTATITYTTNGDNEPSTVTVYDTIYTFAVAIKKVDQAGKDLAGAVFELPFYVKTTADSDGAYIYAGRNSGTGLTNSLTTPDNGLIIIKGVKDGTYNFIETAAPDGYNKLTAPVTVEATKTGLTTTSKTTYLDADGNEVDTEEDATNIVIVTIQQLAATPVVVVNKTGAELPSTGGMGTTIFYIIGAILVIGAGVVLVTRRRMNAN
ncbi:MAG: SpaA isopeptide-forming pilin-related protein [Lachnospiraceae bacterium]|nr:SpaA isopeptide-forming pilin-related protein [Lachnospiraceae bacterium]